MRIMRFRHEQANANIQVAEEALSEILFYNQNQVIKNYPTNFSSIAKFFLN